MTLTERKEVVGKVGHNRTIIEPSGGRVAGEDDALYLGVTSYGTRSLVTKKAAHELIRILTDHFGEPAPVTFQSQFAELAVGEQFVIRPANRPGERSNAIKIDNDQFYNYTKTWVKSVREINRQSRIEKVG